MGFLKILGLGDKEHICAGCREKSVLRDRKQPTPRHPGSTRYWGCPYGPGLYCCKPENVSKRIAINVFLRGQKRWA
jgi:hypothetical protein